MVKYHRNTSRYEKINYESEMLKVVFENFRSIKDYDQRIKLAIEIPEISLPRVALNLSWSEKYY